MCVKRFATFTGIALPLLATVQWLVNGWNATLGITYLIGAGILSGAFAAWLAGRDE